MAVADIVALFIPAGSRSRPEMSRLAKNEAFDIQLKLLLIGDSGAYGVLGAMNRPVGVVVSRLPRPLAGVGKTCLLLRFVDDKFSPSFITTIGIDFKVKQVKIGDKKVKLQVRGDSHLPVWRCSRGLLHMPCVAVT